ncbi:glycosyltransferase family 2 protein [Bacillus sp. EB600]|uniref:glycosyltransferase family 2 protein n=1 Tax=Bacillus sp. EB600 TaxID=2806345 RepID=UPI00210A8B84|nr:glycosyltransferase family 2 protein [Bacillus sp. EB600]MCQ6280441.1 glycosyltransferase family 2 protein [Bacillus sp. EB600]
MGILYSVVIPVHNRAEQLMLTLTSFEKQQNAKPFEVIVVDDASTDRTVDVIKQYTDYSPYPITLVSLEERSGPGVARNAGIKQAKGKYIIFCDADFLVLPNFIRAHHKLHSIHKKAVVSGTPYCYKGVYSLYFPNFSEWEFSRMKQSLERTGLWNDALYNSSSIVPILTQKEIRENFDKVYKAVSLFDGIDSKLRKALQDVETAPWLLFITRNVSVEKSALTEAGYFDERLIRGSGEDWELGYRLYRMGYKYVIINKVIGYHQEHPNDFRLPFKHMVSFSSILAEKYGRDEPEISLLSNWYSSDDLWPNIPLYKTALRLYRENYKDNGGLTINEILNRAKDKT